MEGTDRVLRALDGVRDYQKDGAGVFADDIHAVDSFAQDAVQAAIEAKRKVAEIMSRDDLPDDIKAHLRAKTLASARPAVEDSINRARLAEKEVVSKARAALGFGG